VYIYAHLSVECVCAGGRGEAGGSEGSSRVCIEGRGGSDGSIGVVLVHEVADGGVDACAEVALKSLLVDAEDERERQAVAGITPARGVRAVGVARQGVEDVGVELVSCREAMNLSAATLPALPGLCSSMPATVDALRAVVVVGAEGVALAASWAAAAAAAATVTTLGSGGDRPGRGGSTR